LRSAPSEPRQILGLQEGVRSQEGGKMQPNATIVAESPIPPDRGMLQEVKELVGSQTFDHWFHNKATIEISDNEVTIGVTNPFLLNWMQHRFRPAVAEAARRILGESAQIRFKVHPRGAPRVEPQAATQAAPREQQKALPASPPPNSLERNSDAAEPVRTGQPQSRARSGTPRSGSVEAASSADNRKFPESGRRAPSPRHGSSQSTGRRFADLADFVKGPGNELALTAVLQICEQPGSRYNPLVLYGGVGTGKTHLLEATYKRLRASHSGLNVLFLSAEGFANYFTQALRDRTLPSFRQRFRSVDVLVVDDVDFLDGKRVIQEEFLHTIRQLESHDRQIVLSADRHPRLLTKLSEELVTRFIAGIVCRMESPDLETRRAIVTRKAARLTGRVSDEALELVAQRFRSSVREIEGALNCLEAHGLTTGKPVTVSVARHVLADLERDCVRVVRLADVEQTVCQFFAVGPDELRSARRSRSVSQPRMLAMYLARKMTQAAYSEIGEYFGGRNHSTVMSAEKRVLELLRTQATFRVAAQNWKLSDLVGSLEQQLMTG
jgi:chromosomal replication initiator protein